MRPPCVHSERTATDVIEKFDQFRIELELPLKRAWIILQDVDKDLAELAAYAFEQALRLVDRVGTLIMSRNYEVHLTIQMDSSGQLQTIDHDEESTSSEEDTIMFREHILCLMNCTEIVHDHQLMMLAGTHQKYEADASLHALQNLQQVEMALKRWAEWVR